MAGPIDTVYPSGPVDKSLVRADDKTAKRRAMANADAVRNVDLSGQFAGIYVRSTQFTYDLKASDTTTADDMSDTSPCIRDNQGNGFFKVAGGAGDVAGDTHAAASKSSPVDADELPLVDSAVSNVLKKLTWANLKAAIAAYLVSAGWIREKLTGNRTYYIKASGSGGSDTNDGLTAGTPFLTIQKAIDTVAALDCSIYDVGISCGANTYAPFVLKTFLGSGKVTITGDTTTPANCIIASTSADGIGGSNVVGRYKAEGFKFTNATSGSHVKLYNTYLELGANDYGAATTAHIWLEQNAYVTHTAGYTISGGATRHGFATTGGIFDCQSKTVTLTGTPNFTTAYLVGSRTGVFSVAGNTYSGSAPGSRYILSTNAVIDSAAGTLPGNSAGSLSTGGQYL